MTLMKQLEYRPVGARLRAPRFALAYRPMADWVYMARCAVTQVSRVWGGSGAVILPVSGETEQATTHSGLLPSLRNYDPDHVAGLVPTLADAARMDPTVRDRMVAQYATPDESSDTTWNRLSSLSLQMPRWEGLAGQLDGWCSPFKGVRQNKQRFEAHNVRNLGQEHDSRGSLATVSVPPDDQMFTLDLSRVDPAIALMVETRLGSADAAARPDENIMELPVEDEDLPALIHLAITGKPRAIGWDLGSRFRTVANGDSPQELTADEFMAATPFAHTGRWTTRLSSYPPGPAVCVVGETAEDHALAMLCDRQYGHGAWIPTRMLADDGPYRGVIKNALHTLQTLHDDDDLPVLVTSVSEPHEVLEALADDLNRPFAGMTMQVDDGSPVPLEIRKAQAVSPSAVAEHDAMSLLADPVSYQLRQSAPTGQEADGVSILAPLQLPEAEAATHIGPELHWYVDVWLSRHTLPARTALSSSCLTQETGGLPDAVVRAGRQSVTFISANMGFATPDARYARPLLHFPSADKVFEELARARGATVERSDAGRRAAIAAEMWGSPEALAADLTGPVRTVLNSFLPPKTKRDGDYGVGYAVRGDGYVALEDIRTTLDIDIFEARDLADRLLDVNVVRRGLLLNCARCHFEAFYRIELVGSTFDCEACGHTSGVTRGRWYAKDAEPHWYYAIDQVVRNLLRSNGDVPLLAADQLRQKASSVLWSPELEITDSDDSIEIDLCLVADGRIIVGEAKSNNTLKGKKYGTQESAARLVRAAQILSADEIVLATSQNAWARDTRAAVLKAVEDGWRSGPQPAVTEMLSVGEKA
ncbi:hypothetical protein [Streptomyces sp. V4I2]|uniref:hypothetical protein n=1 Tax=Streptomyces sp. V4I2 TaxID=3042280 RepID=UPI002782C47A|nr:hypothetical protein [Streptomyces sp. V4I2]MDQ1045504.1 hypothetical protein [Streptomyces sp. V4I2]